MNAIALQADQATAFFPNRVCTILGFLALVIVLGYLLLAFLRASVCLFVWVRMRRAYNPERLRPLIAQCLNKGFSWRNDYSDENLEIHIAVARSLGIDGKIFFWTCLGRALGLPDNIGQPTIQNALAIRIEDNLGVEHLPQQSWQTMPAPNWHGIAEKLGLDRLESLEKLPIPFILFAFVDYKERRRELL